MQTHEDPVMKVTASSPDLSGYSDARGVEGMRLGHGTIVPHVALGLPIVQRANNIANVDPGAPSAFVIDLSKVDLGKSPSKPGRLQTMRELEFNADMTKLATATAAVVGSPVAIVPAVVGPPAPPDAGVFSVPQFGDLTFNYHHVGVGIEGGLPVVVLGFDRTYKQANAWFPPELEQPLQIRVPKYSMSYSVWSNNVRFVVGTVEYCVLFVDQAVEDDPLRGVLTS